MTTQDLPLFYYRHPQLILFSIIFLLLLLSLFQVDVYTLYKN